MPKTISLRINETMLAKFKKFASIENRSLSNFIETATMRYVEEVELMDELETQSILNNPELMKKLKRGSLDAKERKGKFVNI